VELSSLSPVWASHVLASKLFRRRLSSFLDVLSALFMLGTTESIALRSFSCFGYCGTAETNCCIVMKLTLLTASPSIPLALHLSSEYLNAQVLPALSGQCKPRIQWKPPSTSTFKVNFDAALFPDQQWTGVGVIIRDGQGLPIAALCKRFLSYIRLMMQKL
jgi:hypothetical protein